MPGLGMVVWEEMSSADDDAGQFDTEDRVMIR